MINLIKEFIFNYQVFLDENTFFPVVIYLILCLCIFNYKRLGKVIEGVKALLGGAK